MEIVFTNVKYDVWPFAVGAIFLLIVILFCRKKYSMSYLICCTIFGIYILTVISKVFFPLDISGTYVDVMRQQPFDSFINLIPFYFGPYALLGDTLIGVGLNILLTVPFGFGINFLMKIPPRRFLWVAPALGLSFELTQLAISLILRYPYREIDINDVIFNALGVWIGYLGFRAFAWLYLWVTRRFHIEHGGLSAYVHEVAAGTAKGTSPS
jgi:glycopeptide antibiotics resistance protein